MSGNEYRIRAGKTGNEVKDKRYIEVSNSSSKDNAKIQIWEWNTPYECKTWIPEKQNDGTYTFKNKKSDLYLSFKDNDDVEAAIVQHSNKTCFRLDFTDQPEFGKDSNGAEQPGGSGCNAGLFGYGTFGLFALWLSGRRKMLG